MRKKQQIYIATLMSISAALLDMGISPAAFAFNLTMSDGANSARGADQAATLFGTAGIFTTISNLMLFVVGAISVIMIIIGGLRYVISGGNSGNVTMAKNTILYAIVGLVISIMAYAIINFVISSFTPGAGGAGTNV